MNHDYRVTKTRVWSEVPHYGPNDKSFNPEIQVNGGFEVAAILGYLLEALNE